MRRKIVAGNWKMNTSKSEALALFRELSDGFSGKKLRDDVHIWIAPPFIYQLLALDHFTETKSPVGVIAQNCSQYPKGAYTGEVSANMLSSNGNIGVIIGHSERRMHFGETDDIVAEKVKRALEENLEVILCVGETEKQRSNNEQVQVVSKQIASALSGLGASALKKIVIAYEPVWAIGTGKTAGATQAREMHAAIRKLAEEKFGKEAADRISILYGGSCNASNAKELFSQPDIDGGLIGGASLNAMEFIAIANSF